MDSNILVKEAAHSYAIYTMLVPNGRLLKWADVMLYAVQALENEDEKIREQGAHLFRMELARLVFEPIYAITKAVATNIPKEEENKEIGVKIEEYRKELWKVIKSVKEEIDNGDETPDFISLKYKLIDGLNKVFAYLNDVQEFQYPEIKSSDEVLPEALKNHV